MIFHSSIEPVYFILPLVGFLIGLFGTMLGGGGGFFFLPILTLLIGVPVQTAVITSLVATLPICMVGALGHYQKTNINFRIGLMFSLTGILGAFAGARITGMVSPEQLKAGFGIYSIFIALNMVHGTWKKKRSEAGKVLRSEDSGMRRKVKGSIFGLFAGFITGTFGTSGTAPVLAGLFSMRIPFKLVIGTSLMVVLVNTLFAVGAHFLVGRIDLMLVYFLTAGSIAGAILGPRILTKVKTDRSENKVRYLYAAVMAAIGILMIVR
ncbi:sulfite exporter TauE/SafE family protein [uncultured Sunxiuqinia sp.]|uniref:sulfite exporter TauE/SafE family protein n=1 Tax=uncultured Sunxiuqinia sp. TaxID=1573825 RepID=UPI0030DA8BC7|tara:strand:- start:10533 stop:11330 length:798 start_codon:yes stop_codon:yes gene_type:complete